MNEMPYQPYSLYRRENLYIRDEFDKNNGSEEDINSKITDFQSIVLRTTAKGNGDIPFSQSQQNDNNGSKYWSLYTNQESASILTINNTYVPKYYGKDAKFFEFKLDAGVFGPGALYLSVLQYPNKQEDPPKPPVIPKLGYGTNVYGNNTDVTSAKLIFGEVGFTYIFTDSNNYVPPIFTLDDIVVGGPGAIGGIADCGLATRIFGSTSFETTRAIRDYSNLHNMYYYKPNDTSSAIPPIIPNPVTGNTNVYGNTIDLDNAEPIFGVAGFTYYNSEYPSTDLTNITGNDIVLGGPNTTGGVDEAHAGNATRIFGINSTATKNEVQKYNDLHHQYVSGGTTSIFNKIEIDSSDIIQKFFGPCSWQISNYHRLRFNEMIQLYYFCGLRTDPIPRCEIDNLVVYPYYQIDCEMASLSPMKTETQPKKLEVIRGLNAFQTTTNISAYTDVVLRFYSFDDHTDFVSNADKPHVLCDEKGVTYRGVLELGDVTHLGSGIYEQKIKFSSSNKLGVGWR